MAEIVYVDTCVFIEMLQRDNKKRLEACDALHTRAIKGELVVVTSAISIVEVNKLSDAPALREDESKKILAFFENPYIAIRAVDRQTAEVAHELTRTHGLANLDAIHVATALIVKVPVIYTYDNTKHKRKGLMRHSLKIGTPPLRIENPPAPHKGITEECP